MSKLIFGKTNYKNFGECLTVTNGLFEMYITTEIGPRIIKLNPVGKENIFFEDIDRVLNKEPKLIEDFYGKDNSGWNLYGGHRLWLSPEDSQKTYIPDNDKVNIDISGNVITLMPPVQKALGMMFKIVITLPEDSMTIRVEHIVENCSGHLEECAVWPLSVMSTGGVAVAPISCDDTESLPNRHIVFWRQTDIFDKRAIIGNKYIVLKQEQDINRSWKIGFSNNEGIIYFFNHGYAFKKSYPVDCENSIYPDRGSTCELYTNEFFLEAESLSPLVTLKTGEKITHTETWQLFENVTLENFDDETIDKTVSLLK